MPRPGACYFKSHLERNCPDALPPILLPLHRLHLNILLLNTACMAKEDRHDGLEKIQMITVSTEFYHFSLELVFCNSWTKRSRHDIHRTCKGNTGKQGRGILACMAAHPASFIFDIPELQRKFPLILVTNATCWLCLLRGFWLPSVCLSRPSTPCFTFPSDKTSAATPPLRCVCFPNSFPASLRSREKIVW